MWIIQKLTRNAGILQRDYNSTPAFFVNVPLAPTGQRQRIQRQTNAHVFNGELQKKGP